MCSRGIFLYYLQSKYQIRYFTEFVFRVFGKSFPPCIVCMSKILELSWKTLVIPVNRRCLFRSNFSMYQYNHIFSRKFVLFYDVLFQNYFVENIRVSCEPAPRFAVLFISLLYFVLIFWKINISYYFDETSYDFFSCISINLLLIPFFLVRITIILILKIIYGSFLSLGLHVLLPVALLVHFLDA